MQLKTFLAAVSVGGALLAGCNSLTNTNTPNPSSEEVQENQQGTAEEVTTPSPTPIASYNGNKVDAGVLQPGSTERIKSATLASSGFLMIHRDLNGQPGKIIGNSAIFSGTKSNIEIKLTEPVAAGDKVWIMIHKDVNNNGKVEFPGADAPVTDANNIPVMEMVQITGSAVQPSASPKL